MAILSVFFPDGLYPEDFDPPLPADVNPPLPNLLDFNGSTVLSSESEAQTIQLGNGLVFKFIGVDMTYSGDRATGGTITGVQLLRSDGTTLYQEIIGLDRSFVDTYDAMDFFDGRQFGYWLLAGDDVLNGSDGDDDLDGGAGDDTFHGGDGFDFFRGGSGADTYFGGNDNDQITFDDAHRDPAAYRGAFVVSVNQTLIDPWGNTEAFDSIESFRGSMYGDRFIGSGVDETFLGLGGNDIIDGGDGIDEVRYDRDIRIGGESGVTVDLSQGAAIDGFGRVDTLMNVERVRGTIFDDTLTGDDNDNRLRGEDGNDTLNGGAGNDVMDGGAGVDTTDGGSGNDVHFVNDIGDVIVEAVGGGNDTAAANTSYVLAAGAEVELLRTTSNGGAAAIDLTGNTFSQTILGNAGDNRLSDGGAGGDDTLRGLGGDDIYIVNNSGTTIVEAFGQGTNDRVATSVNFTLAAADDIELFTTTSTGATKTLSLTGNALSQTIVGNAGINVLRSGTGDPDLLRGLGGDDVYRVFNAGDQIIELAGQGSDRVITVVDYTLGAGVDIELFTTDATTGTDNLRLTGNEFGQSITGNAGDNRLEGKGGNDTLRGLGGNDTFVFSRALGPDNVDTIIDFNVADDRFLLSNNVFSALGEHKGAISAGNLRVNTTGQAQDTDDFFIYDSDDGLLFYDEDGFGAAEAIHFASLDANLALTNADFVLA